MFFFSSDLRQRKGFKSNKCKMFKHFAATVKHFALKMIKLEMEMPLEIRGLAQDVDLP